MASLKFDRIDTRGCRNNNPLNIRRSNSAWLGKVPFRLSTDSSFEQFEEMKFGVRAAAKLLYRYIKVYHLRSVFSVINRWAPASDNNDTDSYVKYVSDRLLFYRVNPYYLRADATTISALICAMSYMESNIMFDYESVFNYLLHTKLY